METDAINSQTQAEAKTTTGWAARVPRWRSAGAYAAMLVLLALPFATLYTACSHRRIETINAYQTLAQHTYVAQSADGSSQLLTIDSDGFSWILLVLVAAGIGASLRGVRTLWLVLTSVAGALALFLAVVAAGGPRASSKAEIGFWLSAIAMTLAPAAGERFWRRAALVGAVTVALAAVVVLALVGLIALTAKQTHEQSGDARAPGNRRSPGPPSARLPTRSYSTTRL